MYNALLIGRDVWVIIIIIYPHVCYIYMIVLKIKNWIIQTDPNDPNGPDLETKIDELKTTMRKAEVISIWQYIPTYLY